MVNTIILYDVAHRRDRVRLEALLRERGFVWLFPHARWSSKGLSAHADLPRAIGSRLRGIGYRVVMLEISETQRRRARWVTADVQGRCA